MPDQIQANAIAHETRRLRIFMGYGHDANEELVRGIKSDLEQRGHDVWFDTTENKAGDYWRCSRARRRLASGMNFDFD